MSIAPELADLDPSLGNGLEVARSLGTDPASGLPSVEAGERLARNGPNRLDSAVRIPGWRKFLDQFADPLVYLLLGAVVVSLVAWAIEGAEGTPHEAIVIATIVLANAVLGFVQERKAEQAVAALQRMAATTASVLRDSVERRSSRSAARSIRPRAPGRA